MRALLITCLLCATAAADPPTTNTTITAPVSLAPAPPAPPADAPPSPPAAPKPSPGRVATVEVSAGAGPGLGYDSHGRTGMPVDTTFAMGIGVGIGGFATQHVAILGRLAGAVGPEAAILMFGPEAQLWIDDEYWIAAGAGAVQGAAGQASCGVDQCSKFDVSGAGAELRAGYHLGHSRAPEISLTLLHAGFSSPVSPTIVTFQVGYQLL